MYGLFLQFLLATAALAVDPPPEVEPGSVREVYIVQKGDTLRTIADSYAFLVDDLARWNALKSGGEIKPGQELVLWVAPRELAPTPAGIAPAPAAPPEPVKAEPNRDDGGVGGFVGVQVGPTFALNPLTPAFLPRLEAGIELPAWERRIRIFVAGTWARPVGEGSAQDARVPDGTWTYRLEQTEITAATGLTLRVTGIGKVVPEFSVGPAVWFHRSVVDGESGGSAFGESTESTTRVGVYGSGGAAIALGPGELNAQLAFGTAAFGGTVTGQAMASTLTPLVGYRFVF